MLPYSLGGAATSIISGLIVTRVKKYRAILWFAWSVMTIGYGLMTMLDSHSSTCAFFIYPFIINGEAGSNRSLQCCEGVLAVDCSDWRGLLVPGPSYRVASRDAVEGHGYEHGHIWILEDAGRISRRCNRPGHLV